MKHWRRSLPILAMAVLVMSLAASIAADDNDGAADHKHMRLVAHNDLNGHGDGGEGMVIKPREFVARGTKGLIQPALKVRGREYLRIIYGPEYDAPENLVRLRERGLGGKRNLALREFALGHEALKRFVAREPLRRVHECVFAVLALESEPIDPRL